jgi:diamine N-acetyltransferase
MSATGSAPEVPGVPGVPPPTTLRPAGPADAPAIAALAIQVFCDTYATDGLTPALGAEAFDEYAPARFAERLADRQLAFVLALRGDGLVGFAELRVRATPVPPDAATSGCELVRLYVQPQAQGQGLGRRLLDAATALAAGAGAPLLWLAAWAGNTRALAFYRHCGLHDAGLTQHLIQGTAYDNRVLVRRVSGSGVSRQLPG